MLENLACSYGLYNSQNVLIRLTEKGMTREDAYSLVQKNAMASWKTKKDFKKLLLKDAKVRKYLDPGEIERIFDLEQYMKNIDFIYRRVFGETKG